MLSQRLACTLAAAVTVSALVVAAAPAASGAPPPRSPSAAPLAAIDLRGLFGDENEADEDENEAEEDARAGGRSEEGTGASPSGLLLPLGLGIVALWLARRALRRFSAYPGRRFGSGRSRAWADRQRHLARRNRRGG